MSPVSRASPPLVQRSPPVTKIAAGPSRTPGRPTTSPRPRQAKRPARGVVGSDSSSSEGDDGAGGGGGAKRHTSGTKRNSGEEWAVAAGRAARRRAKKVRSTEDEASGAESRAAASQPSLTVANFPLLPGVATGSTGSGETPPAGPAVTVDIKLMNIFYLYTINVRRGKAPDVHTVSLQT